MAFTYNKKLIHGSISVVSKTGKIYVHLLKYITDSPCNFSPQLLVIVPQNAVHISILSQPISKYSNQSFKNFIFPIDLLSFLVVSHVFETNQNSTISPLSRLLQSFLYSSDYYLFPLHLMKPNYQSCSTCPLLFH